MNLVDNSPRFHAIIARVTMQIERVSMPCSEIVRSRIRANRNHQRIHSQKLIAGEGVPRHADFLTVLLRIFGNGSTENDEVFNVQCVHRESPWSGEDIRPSDGRRWAFGLLSLIPVDAAIAGRAADGDDVGFAVAVEVADG